MRKPKWNSLVRKAIAACVAAIETYNKPVCPHREETFAILVVSAWEALLKARVAQQLGMSAIFVHEPMPKKDGSHGKRKTLRRNRSGNPMTISIEAAMRLCGELPKGRLESACRINIESLIEVRDNAVLFQNEDRDLAHMVHEAGAGALANFCHALNDWFGIPPSMHRFAILPLSFEPLTAADVLVPSSRSKQVANLMRFLDKASEPHHCTESHYVTVLRIETRIVGSRKEGIAIKTTSDPSAPNVHLTEEHIKEKWPMTYDEMVKKIRKRIPGIKVSAIFHEALNQVKKQPNLSHKRKLNPMRENSTYTFFYSDAAIEAMVHIIKERLENKTFI